MASEDQTRIRRGCGKVGHLSRNDARLQVKSLKDKGERGTRKLHTYKCQTCTKANGGFSVFHVGH